MRRTMPPLEFGREFLGWQQGGDEAIDLERWATLTDPKSLPLSRPVALAIDVSPGLRSAAVIAVGRRSDGLFHVELLDHGPGVDWLPAFLETKQARTGAMIYHVGGAAPVASVLPSLSRVRLTSVNATDYAAACGGMQQAVDSAALRHLGDPNLNAAMASVAKKNVGDGAWVMSRRGSIGDISPAVATALALWAIAEVPNYDLLDSVR
jgi:hypothetical protein